MTQTVYLEDGTGIPLELMPISDQAIARYGVNSSISGDSLTDAFAEVSGQIESGTFAMEEGSQFTVISPFTGEEVSVTYHGTANVFASHYEAGGFHANILRYNFDDGRIPLDDGFTHSPIGNISTVPSEGGIRHIFSINADDLIPVINPETSVQGIFQIGIGRDGSGNMDFFQRLNEQELMF